MMERKQLLIAGIIIALGALVYLNKDGFKKESVQDISTLKLNETKPPINNNENNMKQLDFVTTQEGTGERAVKNGDTITVHYTGKLTDGTKFDSSLGRGTPFTFVIGQGSVIEGWELGLLGMKVGEKRTLTIPPDMGYGAQSVGSIPSNSTLVFDVELISIK